MDAENRLNDTSYLAPRCESIAGEECINTKRPLTPSHGAVGPTDGSLPRRLLRWMVRHPGVQAVGVILATVLCFAVLPQVVVPGDLVARSENSHGESLHWAAPARRGHQSTPTGQPTVLPAETPSSVPPTTTTTSSHQQVSLPRTVPIGAAIPSPPTHPNTPSDSGEGSVDHVNSVAVGAPSDTSALALAVHPTLVDIETVLSGNTARFGTGIVLTSSVRSLRATT